MDEFPELAGAIKLIVNVPLDKVAEFKLGAVGAPGVPEVTVTELVEEPIVVPLTALNVIDVGGVPVVEKVPLPCMYEVVGVVVSVIVFQVVPSELY